MKKLTFLIVMVLLYSFSAIANSKEYEVDFNYSQIAKYQLLIRDVAVIKDSFEIMYLFVDVYFEDEGDIYLILTPKDTSISKIYNDKLFGAKDWKQRNKFVQSQVQAMRDAAISENYENYFDVFLFYTRQKYLYENGSAVDDEGNVHPDYSVRDDAPIEIYKLEDGKWVFEEFIPNRNGSTNQQYGIDKANKILKERFGKMAEEMERNKTN